MSYTIIICVYVVRLVVFIIYCIFSLEQTRHRKKESRRFVSAKGENVIFLVASTLGEMEATVGDVNISSSSNPKSFVESDSEREFSNLGIIVESASDSDGENSDRGSLRPLPDRTLSSLASELNSQNNPPVFGSVNVTNSSEVHFGNKTVINGPVTIKQVIGSSLALDNNGYIRTENESASYPAGKTTNVSGSEEHSPRNGPKWKIHPQSLLLGLFGLTITASLIIIISIFLGRNVDDNSITTQPPDIDSNCPIFVTKPTYINMSNMLFPMIAYAILLGGILLMVVLGWNHSSEAGTNPARGSHTSSVELLPNSKLRYVSRTDWIAQPVEDQLDRLKHPAPWVIIAHTATEDCSSQSKCVLVVRNIQTFHIESRNWSDIGYNFLVGGDGSAYVGRGWDYVGAHTKYYNSRSIGIAFIGTFNNVDPPRRQVIACQQLIEEGVALGKIAKNYKLFGHRQLYSTLSPGDRVFSIIQKWPHWSDNNTDSE